MSEINIDVQAVLNDLSEQIKNMTIENAVLRTALKQLQGVQPVQEDEASAPEGSEGVV